MHQELVPDPFLIFLNNTNQSLHARNLKYNILFKTRYFERGLYNFIFFSNPVSFNGQNYQKQKGPRASNQSLFRLQNKFKNIPLFVVYYLTKFDDVM